MAVVAFGLLLFLSQSAEELSVTLIVDCSEILQFFSAHRLLLILLNQVEHHFDLVKYYPMFRNTAEADDCERKKPAKFFFSTILASLEGFAF